MKFYTAMWRLPDSARFPCILLLTDKWNDYGYKTTFHLSYFPSSRSKAFSFDIKILDSSQQSTELPYEFEQLPENYCSLGQTIDFYTQLLSLDREIWHQILVGLNDIVYSKSILNRFIEHEGLKKSLLRFSEAEKAFREAGALFPHNHDEQPNKGLVFSFNYLVPGATESHVIEFDFQADTTQLHRILAIIGRNGTGKTQVLAGFANAMSGLSIENGTFYPQRPSFSKVIAISYSVFDDFVKPSAVEKTFSYQYCGIRQNTRLLTPNKLRNSLETSLKIIHRLKRLPQWNEVITALLPDILDGTEVLQDKSGFLSSNFYDQLSSGQRILLLIMTQVIAHIAEESIILFDEPEIHLHPNAISAVTHALHLLLERFNSYAIIATHSPIVIQEIPAKYVRVFRREGSYPIVDQLTIESFGENLTAITNDVFEIDEGRHNYRNHLRRLSERMTLEQIDAAFEDRLSLNARAFLMAVIAGREVDK